MKLIQQLLVTAVVILVIHNLHGKVFPAKVMKDYEDTLAIMWEVLDADKDGSISASELKSADTDADGAVSLDELLDYTNKYIDGVEVDLNKEDTRVEGTYEIYVPESKEDTMAKLELVKGGEGQYSVKMRYEDQSYDGTDVAVSGNKFTFKITFGDDLVKFVQTWKCTVDEGDLSLEFTELITDPFDESVTLKGKLLVDDDEQHDYANIEGVYEVFLPESVPGDNAIFELTKDGAGEYSAKLTHEHQSLNGTELTVSGNNCTFKTSVPDEPDLYFLVWECAVDDGELSLEYTLQRVEFTPSVMFKGKLVADE